MRRDFRRKQNEQNNKIIIYSVAGVVVLLTIVFALLIYGNSMNEDVKNSQLSSEQIASIVNNDTNTQSASSNLGKSVEEQEKNKDNENEETSANDTTNSNVTSNTQNDSNVNSTSINTTNNNRTMQTTAITTNAKNNSTEAENKPAKQETKKELSFQMPVNGEIVCEFAQDNLVYSETLQEWVTHNGIDIKADKTTVVQAAEEGTIKSIKNDPRYGLTIVIEHENGFQTVYANLLSSEFVSEGEKVEKGQSIGTVGNTAAFESADEPHLHFEIIKDLVQVNPGIYLK